MTLGSNLETLHHLGSSGSVLIPWEGEANAGFGKGSLIPHFAQTASDRAVTSGSLDADSSLAISSAARSREP